MFFLISAISCTKNSSIQEEPATRKIDLTPCTVEGETRDGQTVIHEYYYPIKIDGN